MNPQLSDSSPALQSCSICFDEDVAPELMFTLEACHCQFCKQCVSKYVEHQIHNGHLQILCPSPTCEQRLTDTEIRSLLAADSTILRRYSVLVGNTILATNRTTSRCPFCDHIFDINTLKQASLTKLQHINITDNEANLLLDSSSLSESLTDDDAPLTSRKESEESLSQLPRPLKCPKCLDLYCSQCSVRLTHADWLLYNSNSNYDSKQYSGSERKQWHECQTLNDEILIELDIKKCPQCNHLIQRSGGCAQISCLNCSHVFCWHCLASLDSDFLLLHYDSGPCKNMLGHSRASILLNRIQAIGVCVGVSALMILASPVILISLPCVLGTRYGRFFFMRKKRVKPNRNDNRDPPPQPV